MLQLVLIVLAAMARPEPPVAVYAELDGTWAGVFVGYDKAGKELYRIDVRQTYRTIDDNVQEVVIRDEMADGSVITGRGRNTARRLTDGTLELRCVVEKSDGDRVEHAGRLVTGPDGDTQIVWSSDAPGRTETFRERVDDDVYEINGMGMYGETMMLMNGRYRRVEAGGDE